MINEFSSWLRLVDLEYTKHDYWLEIMNLFLIMDKVDIMIQSFVPVGGENYIGMLMIQTFHKTLGNAWIYY